MSRAPVALGLLVAAAFLAGGCAPRPRPHPQRVAVLPPPPSLPASAPAVSTFIAWGEHSVDSRLAEIGPRARRRWKPEFDRAGLSWPPPSVVLVAFKREKRVDVYAGPSPYEAKFLRSIAITAASGGPGPKLGEGDRQVPEGIYGVDKLNPNSHFHVSLRLAYPNNFDELMAERDHRRHLGGDIMIHGGDQSIGCVAVGDQAAEDLFVIAADAGIENVTVVIAPRDFRRTGESEATAAQPSWVQSLYAQIDLRLRSLPAPAPANSSPRAGRVDARVSAR